MSEGGSSGYSSSTSSNWDAPPAPEHREGGMDMAQFEGKDRYEDLEKAERELAGENVLIKFNLPSGGTVSNPFPHGQTVEYVKAWLDNTQKLEYSHQTLTLNGKVLIDPLSLNDIPDFKTGGVENVVDIKMKDPKA